MEHLHHARKTAPWIDDLVNENIFAGWGIQTASASEFSRVQLVNPAASGVWAYVTLIQLGIPTANTMHRVSLSPSPILTTKSMDVVSTSDGSTSGKCGIYISADATQRVTDALNQFELSVMFNGLSPHLYLDQFPFILKPGAALTVEGITTSSLVRAAFDVIERPISN